jgi:hypothetical protein
LVFVALAGDNTFIKLIISKCAMQILCEVQGTLLSDLIRENVV